MKQWQMEYYCPYPHINIRFTISAETFEEAIQKGNAAVNSLRRTATYEIYSTETRKEK